MIDSSMLPDFIVEAAEHLDEMESSLLRLEQDHEDKEVLDDIFRSIHTIKGAAQFVGIERVSELSHKLENLLDLLRRDELELTGNVTDLLIAGKDRIALLVDELERTQSEETEVDDLVEKIKHIVEGGDAAETGETAETGAAAAGSDEPVPAADEPDEPDEPETVLPEEPRQGSLAEESMADEYDEELYNIFLQQLKENIPFLYAQTVELSISVDKQDVLYRCKDSIRSLKSSANYMGYEKLTQHYSNWQRAIDQAVEQLSGGKMPDLGFMQDYLDEVIRSFPQAMEGYSQEDAEEEDAAGSSGTSIDTELDSIFADDEEGPVAGLEEPDDAGAGETAGRETDVTGDEEEQGIDLDKALDSIFAGGPEDMEEDAAGTPAPDPLEPGGEQISPPESSGTGRELVSDGTVPPLEYEISGDEYDEELISIFLKKLATDTLYILDQLKDVGPGTDKRAVLERCGDAVGRLGGSANYMEYIGLTAYCDLWQQTIADDLAGLSEGIEPDFSIMTEFVNRILEVYPQIAEADKESKERESAPQDEVRTAADTTGATENAPESAEKQAVEQKVPETEEEAETDSDAAAGEEESKALFDKLSSALDSAEYGDSASSDEGMESVIGAMIDVSDREDGEQAEADAAFSPGDEAGIPEKKAEKTDLLDRIIPSASAASVEETGENAPVLQGEPEESDDIDIDDEEDAEAEPVDGTGQAAAQQQRKTETPARKSLSRSSIRVDAEKIDYLMNQVGELVVSRAYFAQLVNEMRGLQQQLMENSGISKAQLKPLHEFSFRLSEAGVHLGRVSNELQEGVMKVRMLPIDQLFKRYPRLVRDLVHKTDKDVRLVTKGEETELDKMVIESISDPLIHIIRNAVDHGIESMAERRRAGKPEQGTLILEAFHESDHIVVEITDDGRGLNTKRIKAKALEKGLIREDELERLSELELSRLIMLPGFSTAKKATETSGRGVGMDVVKKNIEKLNGTVEVVSEAGKGTRLRIKIPLTMAIIQALMVRVGTEKFTIPLTTVEETLRVFRDEISEIEGVDVIHLRDATMPIFQLSKIYNIDRLSQDEDKMFVVVVSTGTQELGLVVDELLGQEEVVIKPLADYLRVESGFGGATILGDGGISLILDIPELVKIATEDQASRQVERSLRYRRKKKRINLEKEEQEEQAVQ
jgi:two-component system chemotaxis sensor kinase CheA